jgi:hypothetical protein
VCHMPSLHLCAHHFASTHVTAPVDPFHLNYPLMPAAANSHFIAPLTNCSSALRGGLLPLLWRWYKVCSSCARPPLLPCTLLMATPILPFDSYHPPLPAILVRNRPLWCLPGLFWSFLHPYLLLVKPCPTSEGSQNVVPYDTRIAQPWAIGTLPPSPLCSTPRLRP